MAIGLPNKRILLIFAPTGLEPVERKVQTLCFHRGKLGGEMLFVVRRLADLFRRTGKPVRAVLSLHVQRLRKPDELVFRLGMIGIELEAPHFECHCAGFVIELDDAVPGSLVVTD